MELIQKYQCFHIIESMINRWFQIEPRASTALFTSSSVKSRWVTRRKTPGPMPEIKTPLALRASVTSLAALGSAEANLNMTMFVSTWGDRRHEAGVSWMIR